MEVRSGYLVGTHLVSSFRLKSPGRLIDPPPRRLSKLAGRCKPKNKEFESDSGNVENKIKVWTPSLKTIQQDDGEDSASWAWFDWDLYNQKWEVPWGGPTVLLGMLGWLVSSIIVGFLTIPQFIKFTGLTSMTELTQLQRAELLLGVQVMETLAGLAVIAIVTRTWQTSPTSELFKLSVKNPFEKRYGWLVWAIIGMGLSLGVNVIISTVLHGLGQEMSGAGTIEAVLGLVSLDVRTYIALITVVGFLAPLLEETVFRGFLLTSLTKWMPTYQAVVLSAFLFGCAHLSVRDFPYLTAVGAVWGFMYVRSRNLLTPMVMHGVWNSTVLTILYVLLSMGVDLKQLI